MPIEWTIHKWAKSAGVDDAVAAALHRHAGGEGAIALEFLRGLDDRERIKSILFSDRKLEDAIVDAIADAVARLRNDCKESVAEMQVKGTEEPCMLL